MTRNGQITIPKSIRERFNVEEGDTVLFVVEDDRVVLRFVDADPLSRAEAEAIKRGIEQLLRGEAIEYTDGMYEGALAEDLDRKGG